MKANHILQTYFFFEKQKQIRPTLEAKKNIWQCGGIFSHRAHGGNVVETLTHDVGGGGSEGGLRWV